MDDYTVADYWFGRGYTRGFLLGIAFVLAFLYVWSAWAIPYMYGPAPITGKQPDTEPRDPPKSTGTE